MSKLNQTILFRIKKEKRRKREDLGGEKEKRNDPGSDPGPGLENNEQRK